MPWEPTKILQPHLFKKSARSRISGSRAALRTVVLPFAKTEARIMFSVAPTLGKERLIVVPSSFSLTSNFSAEPSSSIETPRARSAERCKSMGRRPISQPPGVKSLALLQRETSEPKKTMDERISRIRLSGISKQKTFLESTVRVCPSRVTLQPRWRSIRTAASTSDRNGQL